jgi:ABC-2 type transport system ATP-binding protein
MIEFRDFTKRYRHLTAVEDLSVEVRPGRVVGLLGPNGAGKSTSLRGLLGLVRPTSGAATVFGVPYERLTNPARRVGVHMDGLGFETGMTGRRHLQICAVAADAPPIRAAPHATTCARSRRWPVCRPPVSTRCWTWSGSPTPGGAGWAGTRPA